MRVFSILAVVLALAFAAPAQKKDKNEANTRALAGTVTDDEKPVTGAVVQLKDMRTLQVRSFITLDDGQYHFSGLRADIDYELTARSGEMTATKKLSLFDNRKAAVMNFKLDKK